MIEFLQKLLAPKWVNRDPFNMPDFDCANDGLPTTKGLYRVMVSGDSESCDGHTLYSYPDYETWAEFTPHPNDDTGTFAGLQDEDNYNIFAWCGPYIVPKFCD